MDELLCAQYYAEKVAESAQTLGPSGLGGQLMQLHASGDVLGKTETSLVIAGGREWCGQHAAGECRGREHGRPQVKMRGGRVLYSKEWITMTMMTKMSHCLID